MRSARGVGGVAGLAALAAAVSILGGTPACRHPDTGVVAALIEAHGVVERQDGTAWRRTAAGYGFVLGDVVRTGPSSSARLRVGESGIIRMEPDSRLRFLRGALPQQAGPQLGVELGAAEIEQVGPGVSVLTPAGPALLERGARVRIRAGTESSILEVLVGRATIVKSDGAEAVESGAGVRIRIGAASIERFQVKVGLALVEESAPGSPAGPSPPPPTPPTPAPAGAPAPNPELPPARPAAADETPARAGAARADVTLSAGDSGIVHDSKPSPIVRLRFDHLCAGEGVVEVLGKGRARERLAGHGAVAFKLRAGTQRYRVRCAGDSSGEAARASGVLSLKRDSGSVPLPPRAPSNAIEADGRLYTVLFQTRLPRLTLLWPGAPAGAGNLELHIESAAGARVVRAGRPRYELGSGALAEGKHTWWYVAADGKQSPKTTVTIRFDNAAPTAQFLRTPTATGGRAGTIPVDGIAMEDAKVTAGGQPVAVDDHGRFHAAVAPLEGDAAVAVRLEAPRGGVHYYIRRPQGGR